MSWCLQISQGDLAYGAEKGARIVTGTAKLSQDLRCWLLSPRGHDPMHPGIGSTLDGGALPDGTQVISQLGQIATADRLYEIESEIRRVLYAYQQMQLARIQRDQATMGGKTSFAPGEILYDVRAVDVQQYQDVVLASVKAMSTNGSGTSITLATG